MSTQNYMMTCPLCGYKTDTEYAILLHMEELHAEGTSPFVANQDLDVSEGRDTQAAEQEAASDEDAGLLVHCPIEGCFEQISLAELEDHINFHVIEESEESASDDAVAILDVAPRPGSQREYQSPYSRLDGAARSNREYRRERARSPENRDSAVDAARNRDYERVRPRSPTNHSSTVDAWKKIFSRKPASRNSGSESRPTDGKTLQKRLGKAELGKHAYEHQMPPWLVALLKKGRYTSTEGVVPVLARLLERTSSTEYAYLCHPAAQHISKLRGEGGFCGYRNIQMLSSYIVGARVEGTEQLRNKIPSVFRIQEYIENAWDMGINASGRVETGGIKGTRKYIGTPEAQAMFLGLKIPCEAEGYKSHEKGVAEAALFAAVQQYFERAPFDPRDKVRCTNLPPIYFQHRGHSLTIVGFEQLTSGSLNLLVFDPIYSDPEGITRLIGQAGRHSDTKGDRNKIRNPIPRNSSSMLRLYRRGHSYLRKYHEFELLRLKTKPA